MDIDGRLNSSWMIKPDNPDYWKSLQSFFANVPIIMLYRKLNILMLFCSKWHCFLSLQFLALELTVSISYMLNKSRFTPKMFCYINKSYKTTPCWCPDRIFPTTIFIKKKNYLMKFIINFVFVVVVAASEIQFCPAFGSSSKKWKNIS